MLNKVEIVAGYIHETGEFRVTEYPWYSNKPMTFDEAVVAVKSGMDEFGNEIEFTDPRTSCVRVRKIEQNHAYGLITKQQFIKSIDVGCPWCVYSRSL